MNEIPVQLEPNPAPESEAAFLRGRNEFFWIAGLSLVNSLFALFKANVRFPVGLGVTQLSDGIFLEVFKDGGMIAQGAALFFSLLASGFVVLFGWLAGRGNRVVFLIGILLYGLDALLCLLFKDWFSVAFHVWILFSLFSAYRRTA